MDTKDSKKYMLDTNVFNHVVEGKRPLETLMGRNLYATHVQIDELEKAPPEKRADLLALFKSVGTQTIPTSTSLWGISKLGLCNLSSDPELFQSLLERIKELDRKAGKRKKCENQSKDALIAETAIKNDLILVTNDKNLTKAAREKGCLVVDDID
jgi:predicted nucleic acid-binding protein